MPMASATKTRYMPAKLNFGEAKRRRSVAARLAASPSADRPRPAREGADDNAIYKPHDFNDCYRTSSKAAICKFSPSPEYTQQADPKLHYAMTSRACYTPSLDPGYLADSVHFRAMGGSRSFQQVRDSVKKDRAAASARDSAGNTALMLTCASNTVSLSQIRFLLERGPSGMIDWVNDEGLTALHFAVMGQCVDVVRFLLNNGADVNAGFALHAILPHDYRYGLTPLHLAVQTEGLDVMRLLLERGANVSVQAVQARDPARHGASLNRECLCGGCWSFPKHGFENIMPPAFIPKYPFVRCGTVLNMAVERNDLEKTRFLLERFKGQPSHVLDVNMPNGAGMAPLATACDQVTPAIIALLVEHSADVNLLTHQYTVNLPAHQNTLCDNMTPLHILMSHNRAMFGEFMCSGCNSYTIELDESTLDEALDALLSGGGSGGGGDDLPVVDYSLRDGLGLTAFLEAAAHGHENACHKLLRRGSSPRDVDKQGRSALNLACILNCEEDRLKVVGVLLTAGLGRMFNNDKVVLRRLCRSRSIATLRVLYHGGAISQPELLSAWQEAARRVDHGGLTQREAESSEQFCAQLRGLVSQPRSLLVICLLHFSLRAPVAEHAVRMESLKTMLGFDTVTDSDSDCQDDNSDEEVEEKEKQIGFHFDYARDVHAGSAAVTAAVSDYHNGAHSQSQSSSEVEEEEEEEDSGSDGVDDAYETAEESSENKRDPWVRYTKSEGGEASDVDFGSDEEDDDADADKYAVFNMMSKHFEALYII